jgi:Mn-containing catalase
MYHHVKKLMYTVNAGAVGDRGAGLDVTPYDPQPGTETTSPVDSTPVGAYTNGVGEKQAALHEKTLAKKKKRTSEAA